MWDWSTEERTYYKYCENVNTVDIGLSVLSPVSWLNNPRDRDGN
jgi:hypothetical protein